MKAKEIRELSVSEIETKIAEHKSALHRLKLDHSISGLENPMVLRKTRRIIARLLTELNNKKRINQQ